MVGGRAGCCGYFRVRLTSLGFSGWWDMASSAPWTRQQLLAAFALYCRLPFGRLHRGNSEIIRVATAIGRSPSALAMKLTNIASLDPAITATGRAGLTGASAADRQMWQEMEAPGQLCRRVPIGAIRSRGTFRGTGGEYLGSRSGDSCRDRTSSPYHRPHWAEFLSLGSLERLRRPVLHHGLVRSRLDRSRPHSSVEYGQGQSAKP